MTQGPYLYICVGENGKPSETGLADRRPVEGTLINDEA